MNDFESKSQKFVNYVITKIKNDINNGFRAKLRKASNKSTEYQSWQFLASWVDLEDSISRKSYALIGSSISQQKEPRSGSLGLGESLRDAFGYVPADESGPALSRFRRLLSASSSEELILILRTLLKLLNSKDIDIDYALLLDQILSFDSDYRRDQIKARWAKDFFSSGHKL